MKNTHKILLYSLLLTALLVPNFLVRQFETGLDPSWITGLALANQQKLIFGQDIVFTYGPWAFLHTRFILEESKFFLLLYDAFMLSACFLVFRVLLSKFTSKRETVLLFLCVLLLGYFSFVPIYLADFTVLFVAALILIAYTEKNFFYYTFAVLIAAISLYIKVSYGFIAALLVMVGFALLLASKKISWPALLASFLLYVGFVGATAYFYKIPLGLYFKHSAEIINGYNEAMMLPLYDIQGLLLLVLALLFLANLLLLLLHLFKSETEKIFTLLVFLMVGLCAFYHFKALFVRAGGRYFYFFTIIPTIYGLYYFATLDKRRWFAWSFSVVLVASLSLIAWIKFEKKEVLNAAGLSKNYFIDLFSDVLWKQQPMAHHFEENKLDSLTLKLLQNGGTVDIIPTDISYAYLYGLPYNPRPIFQSYSSYTPFLDSLNAAKYSSGQAPDYLVYSTGSIDGRHHFWDESKTKLAMLQHYELTTQNMVIDTTFDERFYLQKYPDIAEALKNKAISSAYWHYTVVGKYENRKPNANLSFNTLTFQKRTKALDIMLQPQKKQSVQLGENILVSPTEQLLYLQPEIRYSFLGKLFKLFYRAPILETEITLQSGRQMKFKTPVPVLASGVPISHHIMSNEDAALFFQNRITTLDKIVSLRFISPEALFFERDIYCHWYRLEISPPQ